MSVATIQLSPGQKATAREYSRFALQFSAVICFWQSLGIPKVNHGNVTLLKLDGRRFGITNHHVIAHFRERQIAGESLVCQIGNVPIDPLLRLHSSSQAMDLAILDLSEVDPSKIRGTKDIPFHFHEPQVWPPSM